MNHIFMPEEREDALQCLAMMADTNGGRLTIDGVLDTTDDPVGPLNPYFEDDSWQAKH